MQEARAYVKNIGTKVILIDGDQLADYMIDYEIGVFKDISYYIKKIDTDYFSEK